jgi:pyrroline-5-carboxylate reductase
VSTVAVVGVGKLGEALVAGLVRSGRTVVGSERFEERAAFIAGAYGIAMVASEEVDAEVVVLAVKPPDVRATASSLVLRPGALVVSVAAGVPTAAVEACLPPGTPVVRVMPNTPAFVGEGMSALSPGASATEAHLDLVEELLSTVGRVVRVPEAQQDAVTAVSGSGPAYFFAVVEAMAAAGEQLGLPAETALALARQTLVGAGKLLGESPSSPAELRQAVTSPGGTTAAALASLEASDLPGAFLTALTAARDRSVELAAG